MKTISDLEVIGSLGSGAFGFVKLVKLKGCEGKAFALKCIQKHKVVQYGQQKHILDERNILRSGSNRIDLRTWPGQVDPQRSKQVTCVKKILNLDKVILTLISFSFYIAPSKVINLIFGRLPVDFRSSSEYISFLVKIQKWFIC